MSKTKMVFCCSIILAISLFIAGFCVGRNDTIKSARYGRETDYGYTLIFGNHEHYYS